MAWTEAHITALETAIAQGALQVDFGDRRVRYDSMAELLKVLSTVKRAVRGTSTVPNYRLASHSKGV